MKVWIVVPLFLVLPFLGCSPKKNAAGAAPRMAMQVVVAEATQQPVQEKIALVGSLLANEWVEIKSEIDGTVQQVLFEEGQRVVEGDLLLQLDASELAAQVAEAEANFKLSQSNFERVQQLFRDKLVSQQDFDQASASFQANEASLSLKREQLKNTRITAPFAGIVGARNISPGQVVTKATILTWLTDLDTLKAEVNVPERFIGALKIGQPVNLRVAAYRDETFAGEVYFIAQQIDPNTRTVLIKARLSNPGLKLKPGMFANLDLTTEVRENALVIPERGLSRVMDGDRALVFIVDEKSTAQMRPVRLGLRLPGQVEILEGLQPGDKVVVEGVQKIGPGFAVQIAPARTGETNAPAKS